MDALPIALQSAQDEAEERAATGEHFFVDFYAETALPLRRYLRRMLNDASQADDLLQETYLRLLRAKLPAALNREQRRSYLFRIATNLLHDEAGRRRTKLLDETDAAATPHAAAERQNDVQRLLGELKPRDRQLLWLAYAEQFSHADIAQMTGAGAASIRPMLARARERFLGVLRARGFCDAKSAKEQEQR